MLCARSKEGGGGKGVPLREKQPGYPGCADFKKLGGCELLFQPLSGARLSWSPSFYTPPFHPTGQSVFWKFSVRWTAELWADSGSLERGVAHIN